MLIWNFLLIFILIALNGFFVSVEFAIVASKRARIEILVKQGNHTAKTIKTWLENPAARDRVIAAAQLGVTIVSLALGAVGENTFEALLEPYFSEQHLPTFLETLRPVLSALPLVVSLIIVTSLHVVLGEQVPKVASLNNPEIVAIFSSRPIRIFMSLFKWFVDILDWSTRTILKTLGLQAVGGHSVVYTVDELKEIVTHSEEEGVIESPDREMLHAIFDFGDLLVRQVMIPRTEFKALEANTSLEESIQLATESTFTKFPVYEDNLDQIIGIVHIKDMLRAKQDPQRQNCRIGSLAREAIFVPETISVKALLRLFRLHRQHIAIVLDEFGGTAGLVTLEDILEEIVGDVRDPFDDLQPEILPLSDGTVSIDGLALIEDVNEKLGLELHDPHYDTIAGYVLGKLGHIPKEKDIVEADGLIFQVEAMDGMRIVRILLSRQDARPKPELSPTNPDD